jgi:hypothetical protein
VSDVATESLEEWRGRAERAEAEAVWLRASGQRLAQDLCERLAREEARVARSEAGRRRAEKRRYDMMSSETWRVGLAVVRGPRAIATFVRRRRMAGAAARSVPRR